MDDVRNSSVVHNSTYDAAFPFKMRLWQFLFACNGAVSWRWYDEVTLGRVKKGKIHCHVSGESALFEQGQCFLVNAGALHMYAADESDPDAEMETIQFHPALIADPDSDVFARCVAPLAGCRGLPLLRLDGPEAWQAEACALVGQALSLDRTDFGYELLVRNHVTALWLLLMEHTRRRREALPDSENQLVNEQRAKRMLSYIYRHFQQELTIDLIAASASISRSECFRCFRRAINSKPIEFLNDYRVERAVDLLLHTEQSITDICYQCGFSSPSYFGKVFRSVTGTAPRGFRQQLRRHMERPEAL